MKRWLAPSPAELLGLALILWLIGYTVAGGSTGAGLLRDSQTGYHVRIGEYVLAHHAVPRTDFLSFTRRGEPFFAWEWLAGVGCATLYRWDGLRPLIAVSAILIGFIVLVMMRHMASKGANVFVVVLLIHLGSGASSIHYLARPHLFTLLFLALAVWALDCDRVRPTAGVWLLVPMAALWANLHAGFLGLLVTTSILCSGSTMEWALDRRPDSLRYAIRYGALTAMCFVASLANPYGILEHVHLVRFMRMTWYLKVIGEYQPPRLLSTAGVYYGVLLAGGLAVAVRLLWRRRWAPALLILAWAYASSRSVRHIPIYAIIVLPWIAAELAALWNQWVADKPGSSLAGALRRAAADYQPSMTRTGLFVPIAAAVLFFFSLGIDYPRDFPDPAYPVALVSRHSAEIGRSRVFTTDAWGHYLTFRYPEPYGIYIDGRCDLFGERFTSQYLAALNGEPGWQGSLEGYRVEMVMLPSDVPLATLLRREPGWQMVEDTGSAVLFSAINRPLPAASPFLRSYPPQCGQPSGQRNRIR